MKHRIVVGSFHSPKCPSCGSVMWMEYSKDGEKIFLSCRYPLPCEMKDKKLSVPIQYIEAEEE
ncbi:hypothetical protein ABH944_004852 [Caballeronia udeis]|uniref:DNA topoisomerase type IA zn finger domain-containing protein n=1 Tax=Caballeronia udeis TaxID=1232866 RepID=A0ABW8MMP3_9BURK